MVVLPTWWYIYSGDRLFIGRARRWTKLLNEALRGLTRLSNSLVWNWLEQEGFRSDGKAVCSDLMVSSVVKRLWCSPGLLCPGSIYLVWTLQGFQTVWNQRDQWHFSCCSCLYTLVGSLAEVSVFLSPNGGLRSSFHGCVVGGLTVITENVGHHVEWWANKLLEGPRVCSASFQRLHQVILLINSPSLSRTAARVSGWNKKLQTLDHPWHTVGHRCCWVVRLLRGTEQNRRPSRWCRALAWDPMATEGWGRCEMTHGQTSCRWHDDGRVIMMALSTSFSISGLSNHVPQRAMCLEMFSTINRMSRLECFRLTWVNQSRHLAKAPFVVHECLYLVCIPLQFVM